MVSYTRLFRKCFARKKIFFRERLRAAAAESAALAIRREEDAGRGEPLQPRAEAVRPGRSAMIKGQRIGRLLTENRAGENFATRSSLPSVACLKPPSRRARAANDAPRRNAQYDRRATTRKAHKPPRWVATAPALHNGERPAGRNVRFRRKLRRKIA